MAHRTFRNKHNGQTQLINTGFNFWAFFFGKFYLLYKGMTAPFFRWFVIDFFATPLTLFLWLLIAPFVLGFRYEKIAVEYWTEKGFTEVIGNEIG
jgi:hypothetical protein